MKRKQLIWTLAAVAGASVAWANPADKMDANKDGVVSAEEHAAGAKQMFTRMDANRDGNVTAAEMDAAHEARGEHGRHHEGRHEGPAKHDEAQHGGKHQLSSAEKIKVIDTNGDGSLSAQEHEAGSRSMFSKMDADRDGRLTLAELDAGHERMLKKKM
jgi:Ca2+-binding EF-hand superfamily protein